ncbi:glycosyltransferase [Dysgonomonas sp. 511]|uniref:glycosyltransferase n=1 Tax=Dysgonomonas sp. 511 TaxID=2302930 RepID=UPI0013D6BA98|nr:glycosyltransferase [Dysgonomonas sp. 511]NDV78860.1 glycosyltransferase [Dysgonomonas sp. 511]
MEPKISIIVPIYNSEYYLINCINSIINQTFTDFEVLLIDDGSTDSSGIICDKFAEKDKRVRVFHKKNEGVSIARNLGLDEARGEYIAWVDSDDWVDPLMYERMYKETNENKIDMVWCDYAFVFPDKYDYQSAVTNNSNKNALIQAYLLKDYTMLFNTLVKRSIYNKHRIRCVENLNYAEDFYMTVKLFYFANSFSYINKPFYFYNKCNDLSITSHNAVTWKKITDKISNIQSIIDFFSKEGVLSVFEPYLYWRILANKRQMLSLKVKMKELKRYPLISPQSSRFLASDPNITSKKQYILEYCISRNIFLPIILYRGYLRTILKYFNLKHKIRNNFSKHPSFYRKVSESGITLIKRDKQLIVSLTSYPARINNIHHTINTLLCQSIKPDQVILWLASEQFPNKEKDLPDNLLKLCNFGLTIEWCEDIKSYKKIVPTLRKYPQDIIVTADDDLFYLPNWLELLYEAYLKNPYVLNCHRAHMIRRKADGCIDSYKNWNYSYNGHEESYFNFGTSGSGIIFTKDLFHNNVCNDQIFMRLSPKADDIWIWSMCILNGTKIKVIENNLSKLYELSSSQNESLYQSNKLENDIQLLAIIGYYPQINKNLNSDFM